MLLCSALVLAGCSHAGRRAAGPATTTSTSTSSPSGVVGVGADAPAVDIPVGDHPRGGSASVGMWEEPDPAASTMAGAAVRALVLPQLFVARPDGRWSDGLVAPRSDALGADHLSASFKLRAGAVWSDGTPIGVADLQRSADPRFVAGVDGPAADGTITVRFTHPLVNWRRLWSGNDAITAPADGVWGGPFVVAARTPGLETVLRRNDRWYGSGGGRAPFLDEVHLVLVPDPTTARQLLAAGRLDVVAPLAATERTAQLKALSGTGPGGVSVSSAAAPAGVAGGLSVDLVVNADRIKNADERRALLASVGDRSRFVATLLPGEASVPPDAAGGGGDAGSLNGADVDLVGFAEEPMTSLLYRSMQKRARAAGGTLELRQAEADRVEGWLRDRSYDAGIVIGSEPLGGCAACRWSGFVSDDLLAAADGGDAAATAAVGAALGSSASALPLWRPVSVVAWRAGLSGPVANPFGGSGAWNAWEWWRSPVG